MSLQDEIGSLLGKYSGGTSPEDYEQAAGHFEEVARQAPESNVAGAFSSIFHSPDTGSFGQNISQMFGQSDPNQKAGILNQLLGSAGPGLLSSLAGGGLGSLLGGLVSSGGAAPQVSPDMAQQVPPGAVEELANHAEQQNPSIIDQASSFYAQHPTLIKALGAGAAMLAMRHLASAQRR